MNRHARPLAAPPANRTKSPKIDMIKRFAAFAAFAIFASRAAQP
jgi:hypothetical protein